MNIMKAKILNFHFILLAITIFLNFGQAQNLDVKEIEVKLSKEARKAQRKIKSTFTDLGLYWNNDRTELHKVFTYQIKKDPMMYEIITVDEKGKLTSQESGELKAGALKKYNLEPAESLLKNEGPAISEKQYGFFRRSVLAGQPTLNVGHFVHRYYRGVWYGYKWREEEDFKLEERFWPDFSFAVKGTNLENTSSHLLKKRTSLGKVLQGERNYIPMNGKAVLGGLMATVDQNTYLTGIYDLAQRDWEVKYENHIESKIKMTGGSVDKADQQGAYSLLVCDKGYLLLDIGPEGKILHKIWLDLENTQKKGVPEDWQMEIKDDGGLFIFHTVPGGYSTKKSDIVLFEVKEGVVKNRSYISYDEQAEKLVRAPKSKAKFKQVAGFEIDKLEQLESGDFALHAHTGSPGELDVIFHLKRDLSLSHIFTMDAVPHIMEKASEESGFIPGELYPAGNGEYYWITRNIPGALLQGIHSSSSSSGQGTGVITTTTTTTRIDEVYAHFKIAKVDFNMGSLSKPFYPEKLLAVGANPGQLSKSSNLFMSVLGSKTSKYYNLIIQ